MAAEKRHTKAGQARFLSPDGKHEQVISWGPGYPAVEAPINPGSFIPWQRSEGSDDPSADLEDTPAE